MTEVRELTGPPATVPMMVRAALPAVPLVGSLPGIRRSGDSLPDVKLVRHDVALERDHVEAYSEVCGFRLRDELPLTYPHMLAFGLHMALMTDPAFPYPAIGTVHLENSITQHRPITADERLQVSVHAEGLRPHPKGRLFDILTEVHSGGELVWEETTTLLRRGKGQEDAAASPLADLEVVPGSGTTWHLPGDLGRRYAGVSGDHNPIHLYPLTAKAFGFPRQIAHGMWTKARSVAALEGRLPDAVRVDVAFKKPVVLPATVAFGSRPVDPDADGQKDYEFALTKPRSGAPHLVGRTTALS
ncbi:MAG: MaoC/PaaZ C-terminal domain-containing protein [Nocardioides sp.]|nr:MaoC/PaaZ C-terminal domain-containing protein [Nocardioides sp.]